MTPSEQLFNSLSFMMDYNLGRGCISPHTPRGQRMIASVSNLPGASRPLYLEVSPAVGLAVINCPVAPKALRALRRKRSERGGGEGVI